MTRRMHFLIGSILLVLAITGAWLWFYLYAPRLKMMSAQAVWNLSDAGRWHYLQKALTRTGFRGLGDVSFGRCFIYLSLFGNEKWAEWSIRMLESGVDDQWEGGEHGFIDVLKTITNQNPGNKPNDWVMWWKENSKKTQLQWIVDGFKLQGIEVNLPFDNESAKKLLRTLNIKDEHGYNKCRLLRDSRFDLWEIYKMLPEVGKDPQLLEGVLFYTHFLGRHPWGVAPGRFIGSPVDNLSGYMTVWARPEVNVIMTFLIIASSCGGVVLLFHAFRKRESKSIGGTSVKAAVAKPWFITGLIRKMNPGKDGRLVLAIVTILAGVVFAAMGFTTFINAVCQDDHLLLFFTGFIFVFAGIGHLLFRAYAKSIEKKYRHDQIDVGPLNTEL